MANVQRGVVKPANEEGPRGNRLNSSSPLGHGAPYSDVPNNRNKTDRRNSSGPMTKGRPEMPVPNEDHKFDVADAHAGYEGFASPAPAAEFRSPFGGSFGK